MNNKYTDIIASVAKSLGDNLQDKVAKGGHSIVYFGKKHVYKITEKKVLQKSDRIHSLLTSASSKRLNYLIPKTIQYENLDESSLVVEELKIGEHPIIINGALLTEIAEVLRIVHNIEIEQVLTDFEGDKISANNYWASQLKFANIYADKLRSSGTLDMADSGLVKSCLEVLEEISQKKSSPPHLVITYKDVHESNILVDDEGKLSAIIDWDSAMSGPVELEYVILWHRYPQFWKLIRPKDKTRLDKDTFVSAGIVQALRFWKSFGEDTKYVDKQREALQRTLDLHNQSEQDWLDKL